MVQARNPIRTYSLSELRIGKSWQRRPNGSPGSHLVRIRADGFSQADRVPSAPEAEFPSKDPASQSDWHITWVPAYLWLTGVNGNLGVAGKTIPVSASFSDVFDKLNIGYMTGLDVRKNRVSILADFQYPHLSSGEISTPFGVLYTSAHIDSQMYILDPEIYGRVFDSPKFAVDTLGGIRYCHLRSNLDLRPGLLPAYHASDSRDWVDPIPGGALSVNLKKGWFAMLKGDLGDLVPDHKSFGRSTPAGG
jgi:hypothetical protein